MADEPVLCFDGDGAGLRAAYRAVDLAMPRLKPGKSLKFALLPQGQDPDDLVRSGGREAVERGHRRGAAARRHVVGARDGRAFVRHAGAARGARGARQRSHGSDRRRSRAQILPPGFQRRALRSFFAPRAAQPRARHGASRVGGGNWRERRNGDWQRHRRAANRGQGDALCGGEPAARLKPGASRPPHGGSRCAKR